MPVGMFRSEEGWVQVDYGTGNIPIPRSKYEENKYKPDFDKLPSEAEYLAAEKKKEDDAKGRTWTMVVSATGQHAGPCDQSIFSMRSRAFAHAPQRSRGRPDSA